MKRVLGYINWKRSRERLTDLAMLTRLVEDMLAQRPDHVAMTGDVVNLALESEFASAKTWLAGMGSPENVSFVPGNHDAYVPQALPTLRSAFTPWTSNGPLTDGGVHFPYLRVRGEIALIGLNSGVPTGLFMATGMIGAPQIARLRTILADCRKKGLARIIMVHHAPVLGMALMRRLVDAPELVQALKLEGAELVLHGHHHKRMLNFIPSAKTQVKGGKIPVAGAPSAAMLLKDDKHRAAYHLISVARLGDAVALEIRARGPGGAEGKIIELPPVFLAAR